MFSHYPKFLLLLALLLLLLAAGCSREGEERQAACSSFPEALTLAVGGESETGYDPIMGWGRTGSPLFFSTLLRRDHRMEVTGDLARSWTLSEDRLSWQVTIRDDVVFADGEPLTASDVAFTFNRAAAAGGLVDLSMLEKAQVENEDTVTFRLRYPCSTFVNQLITTGIVAEHAYGENFARNPVGSGPYRFLRLDAGQQLVVEANPLYYGKQPFFKQVVFLFLGEDAAFAAARAGTVQVAAIPQSLAGRAIPGMELVAVKSVDNRGLSFPCQPRGEVDGQIIGNDVTHDPAIRRAINYAIDRKALVNGILAGHGSPAYGPVTGLPWQEVQADIIDTDQVKAANMLASAGWQDRDGDGVLDRGGLAARFTILYRTDDLIRQGLALAVADMLAPLGIKADVEGLSWDEISRREHRDVVVFGWGSLDQKELYNLNHSSMAGRGHYNPGFYANPVVDLALDRALKAADEVEANLWWRAAQWDGRDGFSTRGDASWCWLVNLDHTYLVDSRLRLPNLPIEPHGHGWSITATLSSWRLKGHEGEGEKR